MKYLIIIMFLCGIQGFAQTLTLQGITPVTTEVDFSKKEIYEKVKAFTTEYLVNSNNKITSDVPGESITLDGEVNHKACVINQMMGSKTCFNLIYTVKVTAKDKAYLMEVTSLKAESDKYPDADYMQWFDADGNPAAGLQPLIDGTSEYFQSINKDFKQYIEEGEYW